MQHAEHLKTNGSPGPGPGSSACAPTANKERATRGRSGGACVGPARTRPWTSPGANRRTWVVCSHANPRRPTLRTTRGLSRPFKYRNKAKLRCSVNALQPSAEHGHGSDKQHVQIWGDTPFLCSLVPIQSRIHFFWVNYMLFARNMIIWPTAYITSMPEITSPQTWSRSVDLQSLSGTINETLRFF